MTWRNACTLAIVVVVLAIVLSLSPVAQFLCDHGFAWLYPPSWTGD